MMNRRKKCWDPESPWSCKFFQNKMKAIGKPLQKPLAAEITRSASRQTYQTVRLLADRPRALLAYTAYAYFRWVDDTLDAATSTQPERQDFLQRQTSLLDAACRSEPATGLCAEEQMLFELAGQAQDPGCGLHIYLHNMMLVMAFDVERRGRTITRAELASYTHNLASAVTEAMHYFIGHACFAPHGALRYRAVTAAHMAHMLRDTFDDVQAGYYNIPREVLEAGGFKPDAVHSDPYRAWVRQRVLLAQAHFKSGHTYLQQVGSWRCRLAGMVYAARFESLLDTIAREDFYLRPSYADQQSLGMGLRMGKALLSSLFPRRGVKGESQTTPAPPHL